MDSFRLKMMGGMEERGIGKMVWRSRDSIKVCTNKV